VKRRLIVTGSAGLIGSEICAYFGSLGWEIYGVDNNQRAAFFGPEGDVTRNRERTESTVDGYKHYNIDIRDRVKIPGLVKAAKPDAIVNCAAQPSHDLAAQIPFDDFDINAAGTLNLLEAARRHSPDAVFVHMSTNKVYGDAPNEIAMKELATRWDYADKQYESGIPETFRIDRSKHSLFGASKLAADVLVQEYGRYFGMKTCALRGGCLTGPNHAGVELHGFLSYLAKCNIEGRMYKIYGYKGKQVRDNIHSFDVARFVEEFIGRPRCGEVYNLGGGKGNSCSILEAFETAASITGKKMIYEYTGKNREGDHICYYSDLGKARSHYPDWSITKSLDDIFEEIISSWEDRIAKTGKNRTVKKGEQV